MENIREDILTMDDEIKELNVTARVSKEEKEELIEAVYEDKRIIKYLVDQYNQSQQYRIRAQNQARSLIQGFDEADRQQWSFIEREIENATAQEALNKKYMDIVTDKIPVCRWMKSITGIGPVISAYLYSSFDVTIGKYNTDFLSYAGLNDNNNPWLGKEKANELVADAIEFREKEFRKISEFFEKYCTEKQLKKLTSDFKKLAKTDFDIDDVISTVKEITELDIRSYIDDLSLVVDYVKYIANPKNCDDILIDYAASATGRKFSNVKNGTINNWKRKKSKTSNPTTDDLSAYLAKPPYNTDLKKRMYIIGDMFIKNSGREKSLYGNIYKQKRLEYSRKNNNGEYADQAKAILESKNWDKNTDAYKSLSEGRLPDGQILARARRYAVKLFISHVFEAMYYAEFHEEPPKTYVIQYMGHHDYIAPEVDYRPFIDGEL